MTSSTSHGPLTQAIMGAGASGGLKATPRPCSSTLDRSWTSWAEGWQQVLSLQGHQHPGQMTLLLRRSCISSRGEKHKGEEKGVWFTSLGLELNPPPSWRSWSILWRGLCLSHSGQIIPFREQDSTLPTDTGGSQGKVALNELGRAFEEPFKVEMPFDMGNCSEEGLRDLNVSSTLTFGVDCLE